MLNSLDQQNGEHVSEEETKRQSHTFIVRLLPRYLANGDEQKWYGEFQYVREGEKLVEKKFYDVKQMLNTLSERVREIIS